MVKAVNKTTDDILPQFKDGDFLEGKTLLKDGNATTVLLGLRIITDEGNKTVYRVNVVINYAIVESKDFTTYEKALAYYSQMKVRYLK